MTDEPRYLRVKKWEDFQHYHNRPNPPLWIKMYPRLLNDYGFRQLPELERGRLMSIWLLAGQLRNRIPYDARYVAQVIGAKKVNLDLYVSLGWLEVIDEEGRLLDPDTGLRQIEPGSTPTSRPGSRPRSDIEQNRVEESRSRASKAVPESRDVGTASVFQIPKKALQEGAA